MLKRSQFLIFLLAISGAIALLVKTHSTSRGKEETLSSSLISREVLVDSQDENAISQVKYHARQVTVRVKVGDNSGSGVLIGKENNRYQIITNHHVILSATEESYQVETPDGETYPAKVVEEIDFSGKDLAVLEFRASNREYKIAPFGNSQNLQVGETVIAAGFPFKNFSQPTEEALTINQGKISLFPSQALAEGYQIGYTNAIQKGMSGGPLLNLKGELIAINGMHAYPLWGDPYVYENGAKPSEVVREKMRKFSWAIPIKQVKTMFNENSDSDHINYTN